MKFETGSTSTVLIQVLFSSHNYLMRRQKIFTQTIFRRSFDSLFYRDKFCGILTADYCCSWYVLNTKYSCWLCTCKFTILLYLPYFSSTLWRRFTEPFTPTVISQISRAMWLKLKDRVIWLLTFLNLQRLDEGAY